jgi:hypothetical protein
MMMNLLFTVKYLVHTHTYPVQQQTVFRENFHMIWDHVTCFQNHPILCYHSNIRCLSHCNSFIYSMISGFSYWGIIYYLFVMCSFRSYMIPLSCIMNKVVKTVYEIYLKSQIKLPEFRLWTVQAKCSWFQVSVLLSPPPFPIIF